VKAAGALARCQRGAAFYEAAHPAALQQRQELDAALAAWQQAAAGDVTVAAAADKLLLTGIPSGIADDLSVALCEALLERSVVGIKLRSPASNRDLDTLVACLGESVKRLRAAGGVTAALEREEVSTVVVTEIDLDELAAGTVVDESGFEPLVAEALRAVLVTHSAAHRRGVAVELRLEDVTSPDSLGSLLDELIDGAAPGVAEAPPTAPTESELAGATAEELAELSSRAYGKLTTSGNDPEALAAAATVLSDALDRLTPQARFKLLRRLSESADDKGADALGRAVDNPVLLSAIAQVVMGGTRDSPLATAVGGLLERLRPVEQERQQLIEELDGMAARSGRPLDGIFLEELKEKARREGFASLEVPFRETQDSLLQSAKLRRSTAGQPEIVARTFASLRPEHRFYRSTRLLRAMLQHEVNMAPGTLDSVRALLANSAQDPALADVGGELIEALWDRVILDGPRSPAAEQLFEVMASRTGPDWCIQLLRRLRGRKGADTAMLLSEVLRRIVGVHENDDFVRRLIAALGALDRTVIREVERKIEELPPPGVTVLIARAATDAVSGALSLAQNALRSQDQEVKVAALRALASLADPTVVNFLRRASGLEGRPASTAALFAQRDDPNDLFELQRTAVEALGASRSPLAVPTLRELLTNASTPGVSGPDPMLAWVGRALQINNTPDARAALEHGKRSKIRAVRVACGAES
jgi:hypothetical protein